MSASELEAVVERLRTAREHVDGDAEERIEGLVGKAESALEDGRTLDHGALARMTRTLSELAEDADGETAEAIEAAKDAISSYREGVPGA
ncbi:hypothetical protein BRD14_02985 [Halobacteriales archaeon SW_5_68_122]|nr:MAG: hypothetical protein BRD14_02985 [Halobacteriales archaeon SW_5_68_122]